MPRLYTILLLAALLPVKHTAAQDFSEKEFVTYTTADGLSDNFITGIAQDATGYLWLSTYSGINRFDGSRFVQYHSNSDEKSPASEEFLGMKWLDKDQLVFYTRGIHIVNTRTGERRNLFVPYQDKKYQYKFNVLPEVTTDDSGNVFILNRSGFYQFDKNDKLVYRFDYYSEKDVAMAYFIFGRELLWLNSHQLLITTIDGLYIYDIRLRHIRKAGKDDPPVLTRFLATNYNYSRIFQLKPGVLLILQLNTDSIFYVNIATNTIATSRSPVSFTNDVVHWRTRLIPINDTAYYLTGQVSGFYKLHIQPKTGQVQLYPSKYFGSLLCFNLLHDRDGNLWIGTSNGLYKYNKDRPKLETAYLPPELETAFPNTRINSVCATSRNVYAGSRSNAGLFIFDKEDFRFRKQVLFKTTERFNGLNQVFRISAIDNEQLFLGTNGALLFYNERTGHESLPHDIEWNYGWVNDFYRDRMNCIWVSAFDLLRYHIRERRFTTIPLSKPIPSVPSAICEDNYGNIWLAGHGLSRYNTKTNSFDLRIDSFPYIKMPDRQINDMTIDRKNNIWFGLANNGLICYNIDHGTFRHFTRNSGLPDNTIGSMLLVGNKLWMTSYSGLSCMDIESLQVKSFGKEEGFPAVPIMGGTNLFFDSTQGKLYAGFFNAIVRFDPFQILSQRKKPSLFIENLEINNGKNIYLPGRSISTSWRENDLRITIGTINFSDGRSQGYAYRIIKDTASAWQQLGSQPSFSISNLAPGTHRIQVKVFSLHNRWPEQMKEINIEIIPPFWQQTWFRMLLLVLLLALLYLFINWRINAARKKEMEKTKVQQLMAADYKNRYELEQISNYFSSSLADKKTADEVLWDVAGHLIGRMNYEDCMIYLWNEDKTKMVQKAAYGLKGKPEFISEQVFDVLPGQGVVGHVMQSMQPVLIKDTRKDSRYRVDEAFRLSEICVPIIHDNELMGIIDSEHHQADYFTERDIKILTTIATLIGNKLKQLESEKNLEVKQKELVSINEQLAEAKLSALQAQMNPHFIFNALNSIKRMILEGDNETGSRYLSKFASMIRMTLNHSKETFVTLKENTDYLQTYLQMEQLRFDSSFTWSIDVSDDLDPEETLIPSLMIQPLVENAIWHGLLPSVNEKKLRIEFARKLDTVICTIEDNGIGFRQSILAKEHNKVVHHSVGLDNLRRRIKILNEKFETACSITIKDLDDEQPARSGTKVTLQFKIINN